MTERELFSTFLFYVANVAAAGCCIFISLAHPDWPLAGIVAACIASFALANLMAAWQWLRCRRKPIPNLTVRSVCRTLAFANLLGAAVLVALYLQGDPAVRLGFAAGVFAYTDVVVVAKYVVQRWYRTRMRHHGPPPCADRPTTDR